MRKGNKELLINILTLLMGTAMIAISNGRLVGLMSGCKIGPGGAKHVEREIQAGKVANVLIGIGAILIAITRMMKGACNQL
jgi:hypothetical protein